MQISLLKQIKFKTSSNEKDAHEVTISHESVGHNKFQQISILLSEWGYSTNMIFKNGVNTTFNNACKKIAFGVKKSVDAKKINQQWNPR